MATSPSGISLSPVSQLSAHTPSTFEKELTAINILGRLLLLLTRIIRRRLLRGQPRLGTRIIQIAAVIHGFLQRVALPAKHVVGVRSRAANVHAVHERVGAVGWPQRFVGELGYVPHELVHDLRELDGVRGGAGAAAVGAGALAVGDVGLVVTKWGGMGLVWGREVRVKVRF
jgi:hypothetical protein